MAARRILSTFVDFFMMRTMSRNRSFNITTLRIIFDRSSSKWFHTKSILIRPNRLNPWNTSSIWSPRFPKELAPSKSMNCARRRQCAPLSSPKQAIWSGSGARRSVRANGAALGCSAPPTRQSFAKSSPRCPFISG